MGQRCTPETEWLYAVELEGEDIYFTGVCREHELEIEVELDDEEWTWDYQE